VLFRSSILKIVYERYGVPYSPVTLQNRILAQPFSGMDQATTDAYIKK